MNISQAFRDRVSITDHGVVDQLDPETGETIKSYVITYTIEHEGLEYGLTLASTPLLADLPEAYSAALDMGVYGVLTRAGILP
jgi:hypothetical protein